MTERLVALVVVAASGAYLLNGLALPVGTTAFLSGQSEDMSDSFRSLQFVLLLAIFLVYLVMASQFESLVHPFTVLMAVSIPLPLLLRPSSSTMANATHSSG